MHRYQVYDPSSFLSHRLLDERSFELITNYELDEFETHLCCSVAKFAGDPREHLVVGTAYCKPEEAEPGNGRILVFNVVEAMGSRQLRLISQEATSGAVYNIDPFCGGLLAGINNEARLLAFPLAFPRTCGM